jgi:hypothetical protein
MKCSTCHNFMHIHTECFVHIRDDTYLSCDMAVCDHCGERCLFGFAEKTHELPELAMKDPTDLVVGDVVIR